MSASECRRRNPPPQQPREREVLIIAVESLKHLKHVTRMKTYAEVYVRKEVHVARTRVDGYGETKPTWNEGLKVRFREKLPEEINSLLQQPKNVKMRKKKENSKISNNMANLKGKQNCQLVHFTAYAELRSASSNAKAGAGTLPVTARTLETIIRLSTAHAKLKLRSLGLRLMDLVAIES